MTEPLMYASNSSIQAFKRCRRKWWLAYYVGWRPKEKKVVGPLALGGRVHAALEEMYRDGRHPVEAHADLVAAERTRLLEAGADISALEEDAELGRLMLEGYVEWVESEGMDAGLEVIGVEQKLTLPLYEGQIHLIGKMDLRVRTSDDSRAVLDFKHQPLSEPVLTPDGWVPMGSLAPGDLVIGSAWTPIRVIDVYDAGERDVWEIEFTDHTRVRCSDEHAWPVMVGSPRAGVRTMETREIIERLTTSDRSRKQSLYIQAVDPGAGIDVDLPIDPYVLGAWIANGSKRHRRIHDGTTEHELAILQNIAEIENTEVIYADKRSDERAVVDVSMKSAAALRELGLYETGSVERFIPSDYMYKASLAQRLRLMSGLMDSDGTVTGASTTQYQTSSPRLAEQVADLARSLGWHASIWTQDAPWFTYHGERRQGQPNYRVMLRADRDPFLLHAKNSAKWSAIESSRKIAKQHLPKKIKSITHVGPEDCRCIRVDASDSLYVTTGGVLTHNTAARFTDYDLAPMFEQGPTYWLLDRTSDENDRIDSFKLRLLKKVKRTARATPPFYEEIDVRYNAFAMRNFWSRMHGVLRDMLRVQKSLDAGGDPMVVVYPTPKRDCSWDCDFVRICPMFDSGEAVKEALDAEYEKGDPFAYYGTDEEKEV